MLTNHTHLITDVSEIFTALSEGKKGAGEPGRGIQTEYHRVFHVIY